MQTSTQLNEPQ